MTFVWKWAFKFLSPGQGEIEKQIQMVVYYHAAAIRYIFFYVTEYFTNLNIETDHSWKKNLYYEFTAFTI